MIFHRNRVVILLVLSLEAFAYAGKYIALVPQYFHPGWPLNIAFTVHDTETPVQVSAQLRRKEGTGTPRIIVSTTSSVKSGESKLLTMQVPSEIDKGSFKYSVTLKGSGGLSFVEDTTIMINANETLLFVQTDKNIYKPGQPVRFRVLNLNKDLVPVADSFNVIILNDKGIKLERYDNLTTTVGVADKVFTLPSYATLGDWSIQLQNPDDDEVLYTHKFLVDEYVLPKFSVEVDPQPDFLIWGIYNQPPGVVVNTFYTFGKATQGECFLTIGLKGSPIQARLSKKIPASGKVEFVDIEWARIIGKIPVIKKELLAIVKVKDIMGRTEYGEATIDVFRGDYQVEILPGSPDILHSGIESEFYIKITDHYGNPATGQEAEVSVVMPDMSDVRISVAMEEGRAFTTCRFTPVWNTEDSPANMYESQISGEIRVDLASDRFITATKKLYWYVSENRESVKIESPYNMNITNGVSQEFTVKTTTSSDRNILVYTVVSQGIILETGVVKDNKLTLTPTLAMCPRARLVVYELSQASLNVESEVVADIIELTPRDCLHKQVTVDFDTKQPRTGADVTMQISVVKGSQTVGEVFDVFFLGVDKSIILLQGDTIMTEKKVLNALDSVNDWTLKIKPMDAFTVFADLALDVVTDATVTQVQEDVIMRRAEIMFDDYGGGDVLLSKPTAQNSPSKPVQSNQDIKNRGTSTKVRKNFPDTWLWGHGKTTENGKLSTQVRLPDTITSWTVSAFAINNKGIAVAGKPFELRAFQPFFLSLNLPYSIKKGEEFTLQITVFNYRSQDVNARVSLKISEDFSISGGKLEDGSMEHIVKMEANLATTVVYEINATTIGKIKFNVVAKDVDDDSQHDEVIRELIVKSPGEVRDKTETEVLLLVNDKSLTKTFDIEWPENEIIDGSERLQLKITGQIVGQSINNLDKLVRQPTGCGEQNMIGMVPNVYGAVYITETKQHEAKELMSKMIEHMKTGYQRELGYLHDDGSFSAWGKKDKAGSTWLTAFVMKSFAAASKFINIDPKVLKKAIYFVLSKRNLKALFVEDGKVLHKEMQVGTGDGIPLTVYCLLSILETQEVLSSSTMNSAVDMTIQKVLSEIDQIKSSENLFIPAMTAYAFSLVKNPSSEVREVIADLLKAIEASDVPWTSTETKSVGSSVVMAGAYTLLTYLKLEDLYKAQTVMKWLQKRQNKRGGFGSTQDTVLVLQSLAEFGIFYQNIEATGEVSVNVPGWEKPEKVDISQGRSLLLQIVDLPIDAKEVSITLTGETNTVAVVKIVYTYNTPADENGAESKSTGSNLGLSAQTRYLGSNYHEVEACLSSKLQEGVGMYMIAMNLPSGQVSADSMDVIERQNPGVSRVEVVENTLLMYIDKIPKNDYCVKATLEKQVSVANQMPGSITYSSYYEPEFYKEAALSLTDAVDCSIDQCGGAATISLTSVLLTTFICFATSLLACI